MRNEEQIAHLINAPVHSISPIYAGVSNTSYLVNYRYVVRIKSMAEKLYSAQRERYIMWKIQGLGISESLISLDDIGNKVSQYIPNAKTFKPNEVMVQGAAQLLKKLHTAKIRTLVYFRPFKRFKFYKQASDETTTFSHESLVLKKVHRIYRHHRHVFCHNDVVENNLLYTSKRNYLIDYEFAGKNIALFDLASFISENNLTDQHLIKLFLDTYGASDKQINDLPYMVMFLNLLWYYWAIERYKTTKKEIFKKIADEKKTHIQADMRSLLILK
ncbi:MAG: choline kinase family protein [Bacilli bacterium]|nr:choline kinase family protein [Bacilli bacterium]